MTASNRMRLTPNVGVTSSKRAANATPVTPSPRPSDQRPPDTGTWRSTLDGWVRDGAIRRDCLIALAMMVLAVLGLAWIVVSNGVRFPRFAGDLVIRIRPTRLGS